MNPATRLLIFAKSPEPGRAKTRLIPALGVEGAARCAAALIRHALRTAIAADIGDIELWCLPDCDRPFFAACHREFGLRLRRQQGSDLGERMCHAFATSFVERRYTLLMGTDCPTLFPSDLREAAGLLRRGYDAVLTPAFDGGYVLIGLRRVRPELFSGIEWGTKRVLSQTRTRLRSFGYRWKELPPRFDIDHPDDLKHFVAKHPDWRPLLAGLPSS
jgi:rSAM/selenodomain-associated transferase 1